MRYLLVLLLAALPAAHADECHGLTPNATFPNVCEPDEFRTDGNRKRTNNVTDCAYTYTSYGVPKGCSGSYTSSREKCRENCDFDDIFNFMGVKKYKYYDYVYEKNPGNSETGLVAKSDTSKFLCKDVDTGFLCKNDDKDDEVFYCGCKKAEGGTFSKTCYYTTDDENDVLILMILLVVLFLCHCAYVFGAYVFNTCVFWNSKKTGRCNMGWLFFCAWRR